MPRTNLSTSLGATVETDIPDDVEWTMMLFTLKRHDSVCLPVLKKPLGQHFLTGGDRESVIIMSRERSQMSTGYTLMITLASLILESLQVNYD